MLRNTETQKNTPEWHSRQQRESQDRQDAKTLPIPVVEEADTLESFVRDNGDWLAGLMRRKEGRR